VFLFAMSGSSVLFLALISIVCSSPVVIYGSKGKHGWNFFFFFFFFFFFSLICASHRLCKFVLTCKMLPI
jgi:hypothetical protein